MNKKQLEDRYDAESSRYPLLLKVPKGTYVTVNLKGRCHDCGMKGRQAGHQDCRYPQDH